MPGVHSHRLLESRRNELHLFLRAANKRVVEGSLCTYLTVNQVTHPAVYAGLPEAQAALATLRDDLLRLARDACAAVVTAVETGEGLPDVWRYERSLAAAKSSVVTEITAAIDRVFESLQSTGSDADEDAILRTAIGVESVATTVMVFLAQLCTTLTERRGKPIKNGSAALLTFVSNATESLSKWISAILPVSASVSG